MRSKFEENRSTIQAAQPRRILIIRPSALGDVCRTVPVLASLRRACPQARIDWLVQDDFGPAIVAHPALDEMITFPRARLARWWRSPGQLMQTLGWFIRLRRGHYDLVLDCQGLGRSGLMALATGAPRRIGLRTARELAWLGYTIRAPRFNEQELPLHTVDQMLLLVEAIGIQPLRDMRLYVAYEQQAWWAAQRNAAGLNQTSYAVLAPTSRWPSKRWPIERFSQLIGPLRERGFQKVAVIGSSSEVHQVRPLVEHHTAHVIDLAGQTSVSQTMAVIAQADLVVANDSAPLHMAVGFDRPCVGLFGPTDPALVGPYRRPEAVIRGYAARPNESVNFKDPRLGDRLMRFISTAAVLQRIDRVLANWPIRPDRGRAKPRAAVP